MLESVSRIWWVVAVKIKIDGVAIAVVLVYFLVLMKTNNYGNRPVTTVPNTEIRKPFSK